MKTPTTSTASCAVAWLFWKSRSPACRSLLRRLGAPEASNCERELQRVRPLEPARTLHALDQQLGQRLGLRQGAEAGVDVDVAHVAQVDELRAPATRPIARAV